jgi:hypothetical protein
VIVRITTRLTLAAVCISALLGLMIAVGLAHVLPPLSEVKATVFDETGAVIPGCETVFRSDSETIVSHTGTDGSVTVRMRNGRYALTTNRAGFVKSEVQVAIPMPGTLRIVLKVDHTPTDGPIGDGVPTTTSDLPSVMGPEPSSRPPSRPARKNRSWQCLYLWKCSTS